MSDTFKKITAVISEQLNVEEDKIKRESNLVDDLGADSLDVVETIMALEEAFDVEIPDEDAENMKTVQDIEEHINKQQ